MSRLGKERIEMDEEPDVGAARAALHELQIDLEQAFHSHTKSLSLNDDQIKELLSRWISEVRNIRSMLGDIP